MANDRQRIVIPLVSVETLTSDSVVRRTETNTITSDAVIYKTTNFKPQFTVTEDHFKVTIEDDDLNVANTRKFE